MQKFGNLKFSVMAQKSLLVLVPEEWYDWPAVVAQLVERSFPNPEFRGSNPLIGKPFIAYLLKRRKRNKKRPGRAHLKKERYE